MGNMFIGFPVPRAKIADMIIGSAPPLEHSENHEPDGSDPIVLPGDISTDEMLQWNGSKFIGAAGGGGIESSFDSPGYYNHINLTSNDDFNFQNSGTGVATCNEDYADLYTAGSSQSVGQMEKINTYSAPELLWTKRRRFRTRVYFVTFELSFGEMWIMTGQRLDNYMQSNGFGFYLHGNELFGVTSIYGAAENTVFLGSINDSLPGDKFILEAEFLPGDRVKFWVNGVYKDQITAAVPSGTTRKDYIMCLRVKNEYNDPDWKDVEMRLTDWEFSQDA